MLFGGGLSVCLSISLSGCVSSCDQDISLMGYRNELKIETLILISNTNVHIIFCEKSKTGNCQKWLKIAFLDFCVIFPLHGSPIFFKSTIWCNSNALLLVKKSPRNPDYRKYEELCKKYFAETWNLSMYWNIDDHGSVWW